MRASFRLSQHGQDFPGALLSLLQQLGRSWESLRGEFSMLVFPSLEISPSHLPIHGQELLCASGKVSRGALTPGGMLGVRIPGEKQAWMVQKPLQTWLFSHRARGKGLGLSCSHPNSWKISERLIPLPWKWDYLPPGSGGRAQPLPGPLPCPQGWLGTLFPALGTPKSSLAPFAIVGAGTGLSGTGIDPLDDPNHAGQAGPLQLLGELV